MKIQQKPFGTLPNGETVWQYDLKNNTGMSVSILSYGATIAAILCPDRTGETRNVVWSLPTLEEYLAQTIYLGATVGRVVGRIAGAEFPLDGKTVRLEANDGPNHLHGGKYGLHQKNWQAAQKEGKLCLSTLCYEAQDGYPGDLFVEIAYDLTDAGELCLRYGMRCTKRSICSITNHSYFHLGGGPAATVEAQRLRISAREYVDNLPGLLAEHTPRPVAGTVFDFNEERPIYPATQKPAALAATQGYNHAFLMLPESEGAAACLRDAGSGIALEVSTTMPSIQLYTANSVDAGCFLPGGRCYPAYGAVCLETQFVPDAIHSDALPQPILEAEKTSFQTTKYKFKTIY